MTTLSSYLIELLEGYGVDTVFGIPGVHTVEMYRGLADSSIRHIAARHEQSLGFMADGYARSSGKVGVCFVITGPGVTNILTAMGQAYADSIPMLVISGVNPFGRMGSGNGYLHELPNQQALTAQVSAFSHTITHPDELEQVLARAFAVLDGARPRPVHIEIPLNLMQAPVQARSTAVPVRIRPSAAHPDALQRAAGLLHQAKRPVLIAGGGAIGAVDAVRALATHLDAPTVLTINARGLLGADHPLAISASPSFPAVRQLLAASDVVLAIGTELGPTDFDCYDNAPFSLAAPLLRIEIDAQQMVRNCIPSIPLLGDAAASTQALLELLQSKPTRGENDHGDGKGNSNSNLKATGAARAQATASQGLQELSTGMQADIALLHTVRDALPDAFFVGDSTRMVYAGNMGFAATAPRSWFNASVGFGALGYGLPAAIGAAIARPQRKVICLAGDGGFQFTMAEMGTAMEVEAPIVVLLLNNHGYGEIKSAMQAASVSPIGVDLHTPDFVATAKAYGWQALRFAHGTAPATIAAAIAAARSPTLVEIEVHTLVA